MNYFTIHSASNLVHSVVASRSTPSDTGNVRFIPASTKALSAYYNWREKNTGLCPDIGEIAARSAAVLDFITEHPDADLHDLHEQFQCGTTAARAYLDRHSRSSVMASPSA